MTGSFWIKLGAISGFLAVTMGAFGAHGLEKQLAATGRADNFETAARYQMYHALALLVLGLLVSIGKPSTAANVAGWSFFAGSLIFSVSLYILALTGERWLGAITPFGGVGMLVGWVALAIAAGSTQMKM